MATSGLAAALTTAARPTDTAVVDPLLVGAFGALVALSASRSRRGALLVLAGGAAVLSEASWWALAGVTALAIAVALVFIDRNRVLGALTGGLAVVTLLHQPVAGTHGLTALVTAAIVTPTLVSSYRRIGGGERKLVRRTAIGVLLLAVLATIAFATMALQARIELVEGMDDARAGLEALRRGDTDAATSALAEAESSFRSADTLLGSPITWPARAVPVLAQHADAASVVADSGSELAAVAAIAAEEADYEQLTARAGELDLEMVESMRDPLHDSVRTLSDVDAELADLETDWLLPPLADPIRRLEQEVTEVLPDAQLAADGVAAAPWLFGAETPRRYLVVFGQPAESRNLGGFLGSYGELVATGGNVELTRSGPIEDLLHATDPDSRSLSGPEDYLARYANYDPARNIQNASASPDFPTVASVLGELYPQAGGARIDGAIYLDPHGIAALLELTGPVAVRGLGEPLRSEDAAQFLLVDQYLRFPENAERQELLDASLEATFERLTEVDLPGPRRLGRVLGPAVRGNHLAFSVVEPDAEAFLADVGATGALPPVEDGVDFLSVRTANAAPNKADSFLERRVDYDVVYDPSTGTTEATARITLANGAPTQGPEALVGNRDLDEGRPGAPPAGTAIVNLSLYSVLEVTGATRDGTQLPLTRQPELGRTAWSTLLEIPPGASTTITYQLDGLLDVDEPVYRLDVAHQPLAGDDELAVTVRSAEDEWHPAAAQGLELDGDGAAHTGITQREDERFTLTFEPD